MRCTLVVGWILFSTSAWATTTTVSSMSQLQTAIQNASPGDTILLNNGTYTLPSTSSLDVATPVTIKSVNGAANVTITAPSGTYILLRLGANNITLDGLTLTGATGFGIYVTNFNSPGNALSNVILRNLVVSTTSGNSGQAISFNQVNNSVVELCTVTFSDFHSIAIGSSNYNLIINNTIQQTRATGGGDGILLQNSDHNVISGNSITNTDFDGVQLQGSQYNAITLNTITSPHNGVTLTPYNARNSIRNYVANNVMTLANKSGSDGIWFNNDSDWNMAFANDATGANENGMALFNALGNYMRGNLFHQNPQGGLFIATIGGTGTSTVPANNAVQHNYFFNNQTNGGVTTSGAGATDVSFNVMAGDSGQISIQRAGYVLSNGSSNIKLYANTVQNLNQGENIDATTTGTSLFLNRYINANTHYTFSPAQVQWDSGSTVLGGNYFSNFSANGNPSTGSSPFSGILQDNQGHEGAYVDHYPYQSESMGKVYGITIHTPATNTSAAVGSEKTISWTSQGCVMVDLALVNAGNSATIIASNYPDFGYYRWTVPSVPAGPYSIQVTCKNSAGAAVGASALGAQFNITTSDLIVLSPQSDQIIDPGQSLLVSWKKSANVTQPVNVNIRYSDSTVYSTLQAGVTNDYVVVPVSATSSSKVSIQIVSGSFADSSDGWMTVRNGNGQFTSPATATTFYVGTVYPLEWVGPPGSDYVNIDLVVGTGTKNIATGLADFGRYDMVVPDFRGSGYVRLTFFNFSGSSLGTAQTGTITVQQGAGLSDDQPPSVVLVLPASGSGASETFSLTVSDPNGSSDIASAVLLVNSSLTGTGGCFMNYNRAANAVYLANDNVSAWLGPSAVGSGAPLSNSQCTVNPATASVSVSGNNLTVYFPITFKAAFSGTKTVWGQAIDNSGLSTAFQAAGTWTVTAAATAKVGIYNRTAGAFLLDANGNFTWDGAPPDKLFSWGTGNHNPRYVVVVGDWNGSGTQKVGIFDPGTATWTLDYNGDGVYTPGVDKVFQWGSPGDIPVVGDWNGSGTTKVGTFNPTYAVWLLDYNGNYVWEGPGVDKQVSWGSPGDTPVVGDWNGSGTTKIGIVNTTYELWLLDYNGNYIWEGPSVDKQVSWGSPGDTPVVGDWNGSGTTKIGIVNTTYELWLLDYNGDFIWEGPGVDKQLSWGSPGDVPVVGKW